MTEQLHLRISGKGCRAKLGEASWEGLSVPMSPDPLSCSQRDDEDRLCSGSLLLYHSSPQCIPLSSLPLHATVALNPLEKGPELLLPLP